MISNSDRDEIIKAAEKIVINVLSLDEDFDRSRSFAELGGQSILAVQLQMRLFKELKVRVSVSDLYKAGNIDGLLELIGSSKIKKSGKSKRLKRKNIYEPFPMKDMQKAYLIGRRLEMELGGEPTHAYCEILCDEYDHKRFLDAVQKLIDRFEILRYKFNEDATQQLTEGKVTLNIPVSDISKLNCETQEKYLAKKREEVFEHKFDISTPPLIYFEVTLTGDGKAVIHFCHDGLVVDGWSHEILVRILDEFYCGCDSEIPKLKASYRDYCEYLTELKTTEPYKQDREFWLKWSENMPDNPDMRLLKNADEIQNVKTRQVIRSFNGSIYEKLKEYAKKHNVSPFSILMTIYGKAVARCCGKQRFLLNIPMAKRPPIADDIWEMIGECSGFMLYDFYNKADEKFIDAVKRNHGTLVELLDHDKYSGVEFVGELQQRFKGRIVAPMVFTSTIDVAHTQTNKLKKVYSKTHTSQVWIDAVLMHSDENIILIMDCVDEMIPYETGEFIADAFIAMIELLEKDENELSNCVSVPLNKKSMDVINRINDTDKPLTQNTVGELLKESFERSPDNIAVIDETAEYSYKELYSLCGNIAGAIKDISANVGVFMNRGYMAIAAEVACVLGNHPYMPIEPDMSPGEIAACIRNADIKLIITDSDNESKLSKVYEGKIIDILQIPQSESGEDNYRKAAPNDVAYIINTSGTTGIPKSICISNEGLAECLIETNRRFDIDQDDCVIAITNFCHDMSKFDIFGMLAAGGRIAVTSHDKQKDPVHWMQLIEKGNVTLWNSVPALLEMFLEYGFDIPSSAAANIRLIFSGGDWVRPALAQKAMNELKNCRFVSVGGPSETTLWNICHEVTKEDIADNIIPYGRPFPNTKYHILGENMELCPIGTEGTMYVEGIGVALGYIGNEEETEKKFIYLNGKCLYNTGDRGYYREDGNIIFCGRNDLQIKINGKRIELSGISKQMESYEGVRTAAAVFDKEALIIRAYYTADESLSESKLIDHVKNNCAEYMIPKSFLKLDEMPLTLNGKTDTKKLLSLQSNAVSEPYTDINKNMVKYNSNIETELIKICCELLNCSDIAANSNFFLMGGNSITAIKLISRIRKTFGAELSVYDIMNKPFIYEWAKIISLHNTDKTDTKRKIHNVQQKLPLTYMQEEMWTYEMMNDDSRYIISACVRLDKVADRERFEKAVKKAVGSMEVLFYNFIQGDDGLPVQTASKPDIQIQYIRVKSAEHLDKYKEIISEERMNLAKDELYRFTLFDVADNNGGYSVLMITLHHIIADSETFAIICRAILDAYNETYVYVNKIEGQAEGFTDYVMKKIAERENREEYDLSFIKEYEPLDSKSAREPYALYRAIDKGLIDKVKEEAGKLNASLFDVLLWAYCKAVSDILNKNKLIVSVPVSDRSGGDYEYSTGLFLNKIAVPIQISGVKESVGNVKSSLLSSYAQTSEGFISYVRKNGLEQKLKKIYSEMTFDMITAVQLDNNKKLEFFMDKQVNGSAGLQFMVEENDGMLCRITSGIELFDAKMLERLADEFIFGLECFIGQHEEKSLKYSGGSSVLYGKKTEIKDKTLVEYILENAAEYADKTAVDGPEGTLTYEQFLWKIKAVASKLENAGMKIGDAAAVCCHQDPDTIAAIYGVMYAGGVYVPIDNSILSSEERVAEMVKESNAAFILTRDALPFKTNAEEILIGCENDIQTAPEPEMRCVDPEMTAYIMYTSGSTGKPKGIPICHGDIINTCLWYGDTVNADSASKMILLNNFGFDGSLKHIVTPFLIGASMVTSYDSLYMIPEILSLLSKYNVTHVAAVPSLLNELLSCSAENEFREFETVKCIMSGGESFRADQLYKLISSADHDITIVNMYGPAECACISSGCRIDMETLKSGDISIGTPVWNKNIYIFDENGNIADIGEQGMIYIGGLGIFKGYIGNNSDNSSLILDKVTGSGMMYKTGDIGKINEKGQLIFLGRADNQVKVNGQRVEIEELENVFLKHPNVKNCAYKIFEENNTKKYVMFYVPKDPDKRVTYEDAAAFMSEYLPKSFIPGQFVCISELPLNANGKCDRSALKLQTERPSVKKKKINFKNELALGVINAWKKTLNLDEIELDRGFFESGGTSLLYYRLQNAIKQNCGIEISIANILQYPTAAQQIEFLMHEHH